jgi:hypothetical protein
MTHRFSSLCLAVLAALCACDTAETPEACESLVPRRIALNGSTMQGPYLNGSKIQGVDSQGAELNGVRLQGIWENGIWENGIEGIGLQGTRLVGLDGTLIDALLLGAEIPGRLSDGRVIALEIASIRHEDNLSYYGLSFEGTNICGEGIDGVFVAGTWDATGARNEDSEFPVSYSCTTGVIAKCVQWGYEPWTVGADVHQACTRMARADYCGDGTPHTKNGTAIDVFDALGVQVPTDADAFEFEAAWSPDGATCVSRPRYDERVVGQGEVMPSCWNELPHCDDFDEAQAAAQAQGQPLPVLANASVPQPRLLCAPR